MLDFLLELERASLLFEKSGVRTRQRRLLFGFLRTACNSQRLIREKEESEESPFINGGKEGHLIILERPKSDMAGKGVCCWPHWGTMTLDYDDLAMEE